ncbi:MAG: helix-turn-helix domain-containing protein [Ginsengibacter sp.]
MSVDTSNNLFSLAADLVNYTNRNIFLTGKAGTGKTTFLKHIKNTCHKELAVIDPTGVAAFNAGGNTIHSFFQLPFTPFVPGFVDGTSAELNNTHSLISKLKINSDKRKLLQALELLIIDEISMVRCDMIDEIDTVLKHFRNNPLPFGGVQVLFIGDMHQLPPVIPDHEWNILSNFYSSPYFFSSKIISTEQPLFISFEKIYRQSDPEFIDLLNAVRNSELDHDHVKKLDSLYNPDHINKKHDRSIILTTHNAIADRINEEELMELKTPTNKFKATIEGEFYEKYFPAEELLILKPGAQVMFIKNDSEKIRRYYNGKIGTVKSMDNENIMVECPDDSEPIEVRKETWDNIRYTLNQTTKQIEENVAGSFIQYPLRLAWAITIHKSQGLTFEKAIIDAGAAFSPGQVYVALSRSISLDGLVLKSKINYNSLNTDKRIREFSTNIASVPQIELQLTSAKKEYQQKILTDLLNFSGIYTTASEINKMITTEMKSFNDEAISWIVGLTEEVKNLQDVSHRFLNQLYGFFRENNIPQDNEALQQRIMAAAKYFESHLSSLITKITKAIVVTDSKQLARSFNEVCYELFSDIAEKKYLFENCLNGFNGYSWHEKKKSFRVSPFKLNAYAANSSFVSDTLDHPSLYHKLKNLRDEICNAGNKPVYMVASGQTITEMCNYLPQNLHELSQINGFGKARLKEYGDKFLKVIGDYCEEKGLISNIKNKPAKKQKKTKEKTAK